MKKVNVLIATAALFFSGSVLAASPSPVNPKEKLTAEIHELLHNNSILVEDDQELYAWVRITVNSENEIVVLSVNTVSEQIETFVKNRLNYHKLGSNALEEGETYRIPVRFTS